MYRLLFVFSFLIYTSGSAQNSVYDYIPSNLTFDSNIPRPEQIIGFNVGEWHVSHDKLLQYIYKLAELSNKASLEIIGETHEGRELVNLIISSKENQSRLEEIRLDHLKLSDPDNSSNVDISRMPAVIYMGFSIHGNEPSGSNASMLLAFYLLAGQSDYINKLLRETIIIIDPSLNPDGLTRFSSHVNSFKSVDQNTDPNNLEFNENWPGGRTNHYWFDLNRDWLAVQQPESRARIAQFHKWKPNLLTDHHEMGSNSTFFFQPGVPSRNNPYTPTQVYELTRKLGEYHAAALDSIGSLYFTQENYDDFYYGKGSTYPDINGAVGVLFEQASSRGHARETSNGILSFSFTIKNQLNVALSSLKGLNALREDYLAYQRSFYKESLKESKSSKDKAILFGSTDSWRSFHLAELISKHGVNVYNLRESVSINSKDYNESNAYIIPLENKNYRLIRAMFDKNLSFTDSLFYDVSSWTLPLAFNTNYDFLDVKKFNNNLIGEKFAIENSPKGYIVGESSSYAYAFNWNSYYAPGLLNKLLNSGLIVKVANEEFVSGDNKFNRGSILIPVSIQKYSEDEIYALLKKYSGEFGINIISLSSGLNYESVSLGSPSFENIIKPKIALVVGDGVTTYDAGEIWHLLDVRMQIDVTLIPHSKISSISLTRYNTLIFTDGSYSSLNVSTSDQIKDWVKTGGVLIGFKGALAYFNKIGLGNFNLKTISKSDSLKSSKYSDIDELFGAQEIGGAIVNANIDLTNPLFYGYEHTNLPVFKSDQYFMELAVNGFANPMTYNSSSLISGYMSKRNLKLLDNSSGLGINSYGKGKIIVFTENLNFRAFWYGTNKVFLNSLFFGRFLDQYANR